MVRAIPPPTNTQKPKRQDLSGPSIARFPFFSKDFEDSAKRKTSHFCQFSLLCLTNQRLRKGVGGQSDARKSYASLFLCPLRRRRREFWEAIFAVYRRGIGVGVRGVTGRDAIVHKRRRNSSEKATQ